MTKVLFKSIGGDSAVRDNLPFVNREVVCCILRNPKDDTFLILDHHDYDWKIFVIGGIEDGQGEEDAGRAEIEEETGYTNIKFVEKLTEFEFEAFLQHKQVNRHANVRGLVFELVDDSNVGMGEEEKKLHKYEWHKREDIMGLLTITSHKYFWSVYAGLEFELKPGEDNGIDKFFLLN